MSSVEKWAGERYILYFTQIDYNLDCTLAKIHDNLCNTNTIDNVNTLTEGGCVVCYVLCETRITGDRIVVVSLLIILVVADNSLHGIYVFLKRHSLLCLPTVSSNKHLNH